MKKLGPFGYQAGLQTSLGFLWGCRRHVAWVSVWPHPKYKFFKKLPGEQVYFLTLWIGSRTFGVGWPNDPEKPEPILDPIDKLVDAVDNINHIV